MRAAGSELRADELRLTFTFEGAQIEARAGETIAAALIAAGIRTLRTTREGEPRGLYCGMGVCQDCLVEIDGQPSIRACMTKVEAGIKVSRNITPARLPKPHAQQQVTVARLTPDVLVIGGGPAGLTAALAAAQAGAQATIVDERPVAGGQFYKQPLEVLTEAADDRQFIEGRALIERVRNAGVSIIAGMVANATLPLALTVISGIKRLEFVPKRLVVATGAYERGYPIPGWTLPGVMTTGAAQTLLRSYRVLAGKRIVIAGNGPLNLQVAAELARAGANIVAVLEFAARPGLWNLPALATMATSAPELLRLGYSYVQELRRRKVPLHYATSLREVQPGLVAIAEAMRFEADAVCLNYGFLPGNEILRLLGCRHDYDSRRRQLVTVRDDVMHTSIPKVFAAGDCCGFGGAQAAMAEAVIAGSTAADEALGGASHSRRDEIVKARRDLRRHKRFQRALWTIYRPAAARIAPAAEALLCRCESVAMEAVSDIIGQGSDCVGSLKRQSRLGMGRCQGRYCVPEAVEYLCHAQGRVPAEFSFAAPRPPIRPVPLGMLQACEDTSPSTPHT